MNPITRIPVNVLVGDFWRLHNRLLLIGFDHDGVQFQCCAQAQYLHQIVDGAIVEAEVLAGMAAEYAA